MKHKKTILTRTLGLIAGLFLGTKTPLKMTKTGKIDTFRTSTQKIGVRFSDKIRDTFRKNWIKIR